MKNKQYYGDQFEDLVYKSFLKIFPKEYIFKNIKFDYRNFYKEVKQTEIDILIINGYDIYVIECKNINKPIKGKIISSYWEEFVDNEWVKILNPFYQNRVHVNAVDYYLNKDCGLNANRYTIKSFVVFRNINYIKDEMTKKMSWNIESLIDRIFKNKKIQEKTLVLDLINEKEGI